MTAENVEKARALVLEYGFSETAFDKMVNKISDTLDA